MTTITIASIERKEKRSVVVTTEGRRLGCWTDKLGKFGLDAGGTYDVETEDSDFNGRTLTNIVKAKQVGSMPPPAASTNGNGHSAKDEEIWTLALLKSSIESGQLKIDDKQQLWEATRRFRDLRRAAFDDRVFTPNEAGRKVA